MRALAGVFGAALLAVVLWDAFETIVLPRRVNRRVRLTRLFYRATWQPFSFLVLRVRSDDIAPNDVLEQLIASEVEGGWGRADRFPTVTASGH